MGKTLVTSIKALGMVRPFLLGHSWGWGVRCCAPVSCPLKSELSSLDPQACIRINTHRFQVSCRKGFSQSLEKCVGFTKSYDCESDGVFFCFFSVCDHIHSHYPLWSPPIPSADPLFPDSPPWRNHVHWPLLCCDDFVHVTLWFGYWSLSRLIKVTSKETG